MMNFRQFLPVGLLLPLLVGLALRLVTISGIHAPWGDNGAAVLDVAKNLATGRGYTTNRIWTFYGPPRQFGQPEGNRQPLLPILEAGMMRVSGISFKALQSIPLVFGLVVILLCFRLGKLLSGRLAAGAAAWFAALDPLQIYFSSQIEDQIVFLVFFLGLVLWLAAAPHKRPGGCPIIPALLLAALYLSRANGILFLAAYLVLALYRKETRHASATLLLFLLFASPWLVRNAQVFGNPFHTDNAFFLFTDGFWNVFSVRDQAPSLAEYVANHTVVEMAARWLKGVYLCLEGFFLGNIFRNEPFARGSLSVLILLAIFGLRKPRHRQPVTFVGLSFVFHFVLVSWHGHGTYRYFMPFYAFLFVGAGAGIQQFWRRWGAYPWKAKAAVLLIANLVLVFPLARPLITTIGASDRAVHDEAMEVVEWLQSIRSDEIVLMDFPIIEKYVYIYDLPTVMTPYGSLTDIWGVARDYGATHLVVCPDQLRLIPSLTELWTPEGEKVVEKNVPRFLMPAMSSTGGMFRVYRFVEE